MEPLELSPALLQPQDSAVAILGELLDTLPRENETLPESPGCLYLHVVKFTRELRATLYRNDDTWLRYNVAVDGDDPVTCLSRALAAYRTTPGTIWMCVTRAAIKWMWLLSELVYSWAELAKKATKLCDTCKDLATKVTDRATTATARARELQDAAARYGTALEQWVELAQALGREEGAEVVAGHGAQVREQAWVAASEAARATMVRQRVEASLGLLERLVAACDEATAFPRELQRRVGEIEVALKGTNMGYFDIPEDLVAKVAEAERLWEANARLAMRQLLGTLPNFLYFYFTGGPTGPSGCGVAERCQRAIEDIPRLLQPPAHPQSLPTVSPVSMELQELSPALLQPQVTVVAVLGELLATLPRLDEEMLLLKSVVRLYRDLEDFTRNLWVTLYCIEGTWWRCNVTSDDDGPDTSLSQALVDYKSIPGTKWDHVTMAARKWHRSAYVLVDRWAQLAWATTKLPYTCRNWATKAAVRAATAIARARELQAKAARYGTAQENMVELGLALGREEGAQVVAGREALVRREARVADSEATRATMVRERLEVALGLLERLVAACDEATVFPRELQWQLRDIEAALKGRNEGSCDIPEDLVAKVAEAEQLWEANTRLAKDHLLGTLQDMVSFYFNGDPASPSACGVAERCQRAIEDIPRLFRPPECPPCVPGVSPVSVESQELSPALLQPQVTVVAILGKLLATLPRRDKMKLMSAVDLYWDLVNFTKDLRVTLYCTDDTWWCCNVTSDGDDPVTSLSQILTTYKSTPGIPQNRVTVAARKWQGLVATLVNSWARLARAATKLHNTCIEAAAEAVDRVTQARELQDEAARYGIAQEDMAELGQALGGEEGAEEEHSYKAQVRIEAWVAASEATSATMVRERVWASLGLLERLVAACDEATAFPRELQRLLRDTEAALEGTNEVFPDVPEDLVAKVAVAERLWEANACLVKDHLVGTVDDIIKFFFPDGRTSPSGCGVAEQCQRAIEDIPKLLRPMECPQSVPKVSPVSMELQELSPALLRPQVTVVAILGELLDIVPRWDEEMMMLLKSPMCLYSELLGFTEEFSCTPYGIDEAWYHRNGKSVEETPTSLSRALAAYKSTPWTTWFHVRMVAKKWQESVDWHVKNWAKMSRKATKLRNACRVTVTELTDKVATNTARARELQDEAARDGTAQENMVELGQALGGEERAEVVAGHEALVGREARVTASLATRASRRRQRLEASLGLLERLVAACDEATKFPRELQRRVWEIEVALKGTNEGSPDVPEDLVAKVAEAERLWEANARLAKDHLVGPLQDIIGFYFTCGPTRICRVAERCQRAIEDIPRLLQVPERPQSEPKMPPVSMELQELSPALLQPQVTVVATLGELLATLPRRDKEMLLPVSTVSLCWDLVDFTESLWITLYCTKGTWWSRNVTHDDGDPLTSLSGVLAAYDSTRWTRWDHVTMAAGKWQRSVSVLVNSWTKLARNATKLRNTCREAAADAAKRADTATAQARELQAKAAHDGTAQENMVELGQALGREEGAEVVVGHGAQVSREAMVAASEATRATMVRQRLEAALGLLERLAAACDEATAFPRELQSRVGDIKSALKWANMGYFDIPEDLVAKVAVAERLWEANARLAKDHLVGAVPDAIKLFFSGGPASPSACEVTERCQRATEDIPRLLRTPESPQSIPEVSPVSMELQELSSPQLSPALLQSQVTMVAILGELLDTVARRDDTLPWHAVTLLQEFTTQLEATLECIDDTWWCRDVTSSDDDPSTSLSQALAAYKSTPGTARNRVTMAASKWQRSVSVLMNSWDRLTRKATELRNICREVATQVLANEATSATMVRQRVEAALELVQRLVAAFDEATAFPQELQRLLRDTKTSLEGTNEASPEVPEDLVAKVAVAERLWEANARLATRHLLGTLPNFMMFYLTGAPTSPSASEVAERCQRATEDIPRLLRPLECPQSVPNVFLLSMDPQELSPALLQPQVTVVAILGKLLDTLPRLHEETVYEEMVHEETLPSFTENLYWDLERFTRNLRAALYSVDDTWWHNIVTSDDDDPVTSLSQALTAYESTPGTAWDNVRMAASKWHRSVSVLVDNWAQLSKTASELRHDCRDLVPKAAGNVDRATTKARRLRDKAARYGTAQENMGELGQALGREERAEVVAGHEARVRREAREAASKATRATMVRQRLEASLGLLEHLVAACEKATTFPRELQRRVGDIQATLKGTNEASPNVPEDLVAKVAEAERLWEANARLAKDHLLGTLQDIKFYFTIGPEPHNACGVAERCQRAIEDIPRLLRSPECPQSIPEMSPESMELQEALPALLQPQVTVVAILGELVGTLPRLDEMNVLMSRRCLYGDLEYFKKELRVTLYRSHDTWWRHKITSDDDGPVTSLSQALATYKSTPGTTWDDVTMAASKWRWSVSNLVDRWAPLARRATKLPSACRDLATKVANRAAMARARELQGKAARDGTAQENMVELGQALGREEGAEVVAGHGAQVRREGRVAASLATRATMVRERLEAALGLLERLVAACDEATAFPRELQRRVGDIEAALEGTNEASPDVPEDLVAKVAVAEWLWEANAHLVKDHLFGTLQDIKFYCYGGPASPSGCGVAERCQRAIEDIPRLLRPPECPQSIRDVSPVSMELQEVSPPQLLEALVSVVATLGKVTATVTGPRRGMRRCVPPKLLHAALRIFTWSLRKALEHRRGTSMGEPGVPSLGQALATLGATSGATWADVRAAGSAWRELVSVCEERWKQLVEEITKLRDACEDAALAWARDQQDKSTRRGTAGDNLAATAQQLMVALEGDEEASVGPTRDAQVAMDTSEAMGEAVVATRQARATTRKKHWAEVALEPLQRLVTTCDKATEFISYMECQLRDIEAALEGKQEASSDVPEDLVAAVAKFEQLWEASARLFKHHLLGTLGNIHDLLLSPYGGRGGHNGPGSRAVAERCQKAIEDIPRLLQDSDVTATRSSWQ
ncbi:uncharacterized protein LOC141725800 isoform X1 [Zonotrichia albicollis]|uniref:uncharacterized protein LOC141725800 isoform X1 n=1 Tax=Zonotrichia albicollis TaxID=44394 RepID=UPI003D810C3E